VPRSAASDPPLSQVAWHPDGGCQLLAAGADGDVQVFERLSWSPLAALASDALAGPVAAVAPSPNGLYVLAADRRGGAAVIEAGTGATVSSSRGEAPVAAAAWSPDGNAAAVVDAQGLARAWEDPVPGDKTSPADLSALAGAAGDGAGTAGAIEAALLMDAEAEGDGDEGGEDAEGGGGSDSDGDSMADFIEDDAGVFAAEGLGGGGGRRARRPRKGRRRAGGPVRVRWAAPQRPVQPGATPFHPESRRRFLAYNLAGYVSALDNGEYLTLNGHLHDSLAKVRPVALNAYHGVCLAAIGGDGVAWGSVRDAAEHAREGAAARTYDGVGFLHFDSWAGARREWGQPLPAGEAPVALAVGEGFLAVATTARALRVFSLGGVQLAVVSLEGDAVALAAQGDRLAVLHHAAFVSRDGDQRLGYQVWGVGDRALVSRGPVALSPGAAVAWAGFSEDGFLAVYDSAGWARVRSDEWGGQWVPVFAAAEHRKNDAEELHVVGLSSDDVHCIVARRGEPPQPHPRPVQTRFPARVPVAPGPGAELEEQRLRRRVVAEAIRALAAGGDPAALDALEDEERALDVSSLRQMKDALDGEDWVRAFDLAAGMLTLPMLEGALRLAGAARNAPLTQRVAALLDARTAAEEARQEAEAAALGLGLGGGEAGAPGAGGGDAPRGDGAGGDDDEDVTVAVPAGAAAEALAPRAGQGNVPAAPPGKAADPFARGRAKGPAAGKKRVAEAPPAEARTKGNPFARKKAA